MKGSNVGRFRVVSVQWIDVLEDVDSIEDAVRVAGEAYYSLDLEGREALPSVAVALDLEGCSLEDGRAALLEVLGAVLDVEVQE